MAYLGFFLPIVFVVVAMATPAPSPPENSEIQYATSKSSPNCVRASLSSCIYVHILEENSDGERRKACLFLVLPLVVFFFFFLAF